MGFFSAQASKDNNRVAREKARAVFERGVSMYRPEAICSTEIVGLTDDRQVFVLNSALDRLAVFVSRPNESAYNIPAFRAGYTGCVSCILHVHTITVWISLSSSIHSLPLFQRQFLIFRFRRSHTFIRSNYLDTSTIFAIAI